MDTQYAKRYAVIDHGALSVYESHETFTAGADELHRFCLDGDRCDVVPEKDRVSFTIWQGSQSVITCKEASSLFSSAYTNHTLFIA